MIRVLKTDSYNTRGYTDENSLAAMGLIAPDWLTRKMTYLYGKEATPKFSFLSMTEGNGVTSYKENKTTTGVNDVQYKWAVMGAMKYGCEFVSCVEVDAGITNPGIGHSDIHVFFTDRMAIRDYGLLAPDGVTQLQVKSDGEARGTGFLYTLELRGGDATSFVTLDNFTQGKVWTLLDPKVPESGSIGNESRTMAPGEMTNQTSFARYTQVIKGNAANKVVVYEFSGADTENGQPATLWMNEEQRQFEVWIRTMRNTAAYTDEYNRVNGEIPLKYWKNNEPIPIGAGIRQSIIDGGIYITHTGDLALTIINNALGSVMNTESDTGTMEYVVHGGKGFLRLLNQAIVNDAKSNLFHVALGEKMINGKDGKLSYGNSFNQYITEDGHTLTAIHDVMFDTGLLAKHDKANGRMYNGLPFSSYTGVAMDYSTRDGQRNVQMVGMKGQSWIAGVYEGMSPIPDSWKVGNRNNGSVKQLGTDEDKATYEVKTSSSVNILDASNCVLFEFAE
jgi:hypothetical protein